ncbi:MAG: hypothetical protein KF819_37785 [Labilithrix sp.]|nr:hypothetical protein [Labilithrix sp.]
MRRGVTIVSAVAFAFIGPRLTTAQDRPASEPFAFEPPSGFLETKDDPGTLGPGVEKAWLHPTEVLTFSPRIMLTRSKQGGTVEPNDLSRLAAGMPATLGESGLSWVDVRRETRVRADGAHVGLIEGDCEKKLTLPEGQEGLLKYRRLYLVFPVDGGGSVIITSLYPQEQAAKWAPILESMIGTTKGVAVRLPGPPAWMIGAWATAGAVVGWLAASMLSKRSAKIDAKVEAKVEAKKSEET